MRALLLFISVALVACQYDPNIAKTVLSVMDQSVSPCQDFYLYSCGTWINNTVLPADKSRLTRSFTTIEDFNQAILQTIVSNQTLDPKLNRFFNACMDLDRIEELGIEPVLEELVYADDLGSLSDLIDTVAYLHKIGIYPFFTIGSQIDAKDPSINIAALDQGGLGLPYPSLYLSDDPESTKIRTAYQQHLINMFTLIQDKDPKNSANLVFQLELTIANFTVPPEDLTNPFDTYNRFDLTGLNKLAPNLQWEQYFDDLLANVSDATISNVTVTVPSYFSNLSALLPAFPQAWTPYLRWNILNARAGLLTKAIRDEHFDFYSRILKGQQEPSARWQTCVQAVDVSLGELLGKYFVELAFPGQSKTMALQILSDIIAAMKYDLSTITWMDSVTQARALQKINMITHLIGSPSNPRSYDDVEVTPDYYDNFALALAINTAYALKTIGQPSDKTQWGMTSPTVNAYYDPSRNQMVFPAGILQQPFFNVSFPEPMNYGAIGMVMGHELTHGFDNQGRLYDGTGLLIDWWEPETEQKFETKVKCVIDQYSQFSPVPGVKVNGKLTQGENIADIGGMKNAFRAASEAIGQDHLKDPSIVEGLNKAQLFFVAFAQTWCEKATDAYYRNQVQTDPHSPARFRVLGPLMNLPSFSDVWQCPSGSPMNPTNRCEVW